MTLTQQEINAIKSLERLAKKWPDTLLLFAGMGLSIRKIAPDGSYRRETEVASITGIKCDGGDSD